MINQPKKQAQLLADMTKAEFSDFLLRFVNMRAAEITARRQEAAFSARLTPKKTKKLKAKSWKMPNRWN